jgi:hypothetical protein
MERMSTGSILVVFTLRHEARVRCGWNCTLWSTLYNQERRYRGIAYEEDHLAELRLLGKSFLVLLASGGRFFYREDFLRIDGNPFRRRLGQ